MGAIRSLASIYNAALTIEDSKQVLVKVAHTLGLQYVRVKLMFSMGAKTLQVRSAAFPLGVHYFQT